VKTYSLDLRSRVIDAYYKDKNSVRKIVERLKVSKSWVQKIIKQYRETKDISPKQRGGGNKGLLAEKEEAIERLVAEYPDATLKEYCEYWWEREGVWVSESTMCRKLNKQGLNLKKKRKGAAKGRKR
jgi:transposase